jgi:glycerol-3-phosphate O-acyltransferase
VDHIGDLHTFSARNPPEQSHCWLIKGIERRAAFQNKGVTCQVAFSEVLSCSRLALLSAHTQETSAKQLCDPNVTRI